MKKGEKASNIDLEVVEHFGKEWAKFNYLDDVASDSLDQQFSAYTAPLDLTRFNPKASIAADFGAGSGRWAQRLKPYFRQIYALEPSAAAFEILTAKFKDDSSVCLLHESIDRNSIPANSLDLAMSLGVLHHIPDTKEAIVDIYKKIKPGGTFLCYLYYKIEDKPWQYRAIFLLADSVRNIISRAPHKLRMVLAKLIATLIYLPFARYSRYQINKGRNVSNIPLHHYADMPFIMLENDALDRFGTRLEQRFNKREISEMLSAANFDLSTLIFSEIEPFWTFSINKK